MKRSHGGHDGNSPACQPLLVCDPLHLIDVMNNASHGASQSIRSAHRLDQFGGTAGGCVMRVKDRLDLHHPGRSHAPGVRIELHTQARSPAALLRRRAHARNNLNADSVKIDTCAQSVCALHHSRWWNVCRGHRLDIPREALTLQSSMPARPQVPCHGHRDGEAPLSPTLPGHSETGFPKRPICSSRARSWRSG